MQDGRRGGRQVICCLFKVMLLKINITLNLSDCVRYISNFLVLKSAVHSKDIYIRLLRIVLEDTGRDNLISFSSTLSWDT